MYPIPSVQCLTQPCDHNTVKAMIDASNGPMVVAGVQVDMTLTELMAMFNALRLFIA